MSTLLVFLFLQILSHISYYQMQPEGCEMVLLHFPDEIISLYLYWYFCFLSENCLFCIFCPFFCWSSKIFKNAKIQDVEEESRDFPLQNFIAGLFEALEILSSKSDPKFRLEIKHIEDWIVILWWKLLPWSIWRI